jgi:hypothetical protein
MVGNSIAGGGDQHVQRCRGMRNQVCFRKRARLGGKAGQGRRGGQEGLSLRDKGE